MNALGFTVVRFKNEEVEEELDAVLEKLTKMISNFDRAQTRVLTHFSLKEKGWG